MPHAQHIEQIITLACAMDRAALIQRMMEVPCRFPVDFTPQFLSSLPLDRLRHIFLALCLQAGHLPQSDAAPAV